MELTLDQALQKGVEAHREGKLQEAERLYRAILQSQPTHPDANHNMGVLAVDVGKVETALPFLKKALDVNQTIGQYWLSYIDALIKLDRMADAKSVFNQAKNTGMKGNGFDQIGYKVDGIDIASSKNQDPPISQIQDLIDLYTQGKLQQASADASLLLNKFPNSVTLLNIIGAVNQSIGKLDQALEAYKKAVSIQPNFAEAYNNMGNALKDQGKLEEAIDAYNKAILLKPDYAEAFKNMGVTLRDQEKLDEATAAYTKALSINPDYADAYNSIGNIHKEQGKLEKALEAYNKALSIKPDYAEAYYNMGNALKAQGKLEKAVEAYNKAVSIKSDFSLAHNNMGTALQAQGKLEEAIAGYKKAISIEPNYAEAYWNLSGTTENISEAKTWIVECLVADPNHLKAKLTLGAMQFYESDKSGYEKMLKSSLKDHRYMRSFAWAFSLPKLPPLHFHRWALFDHMIGLSKKDRPFYEFGVWRGEAFRYLIKTLKKGYGFDTFEGLPEDWHNEKTGSYSSDGNVPKIKGGKFIVGKFEDTLPGFFAKKRPMASIINFDADLYSSTICALNFAKPVIDQHTILIFDEFIMNKNWEQDEYKALEEFCSNNDYTYEVLAISFFTKQVAVRIIGI